MLDVDHFKRFNDTYGHVNGDICLQHVSKKIKAHVLRRNDLAARFGGEEFAILLPETNEDTAMMLAEQLREDLQNTAVELETGARVKVTASFGVACLTPNFESDGAELIRIADAALYNAKASGRNCVLPAAETRHQQRKTRQSQIDDNITVLRHG